MPNVVGPFLHYVLMALPFWTVLVGSMIDLCGIPYLCKIVGMCTCLSGFFHAVPCLDDLSSSNSYLQPSPTGCVCLIVCNLESSTVSGLGPTWAVEPQRKNSCL